MAKTVGDKFETELEDLLPREYGEIMGLAAPWLTWYSGHEDNTETRRGDGSHICMIYDLDQAARGRPSPGDLEVLFVKTGYVSYFPKPAIASKGDFRKILLLHLTMKTQI